jgi:hypothetical protein
MEDLLDKLRNLKDYNYQIWNYTLSHSRLTIRATAGQKGHHNIYITFVDVSYFQFPSGWEGDLYLASDNELLEILVRVGIGKLDQVVPMAYIKERYSLYKADSPNGTIFIFGKLASIEDVDPIYN